MISFPIPLSLSPAEGCARRRQDPRGQFRRKLSWPQNAAIGIRVVSRKKGRIDLEMRAREPLLQALCLEASKQRPIRNKRIIMSTARWNKDPEGHLAIDTPRSVAAAVGAALLAAPLESEGLTRFPYALAAERPPMPWLLCR